MAKIQPVQVYAVFIFTILTHQFLAAEGRWTEAMKKTVLAKQGSVVTRSDQNEVKKNTSFQQTPASSNARTFKRRETSPDIANGNQVTAYEDSLRPTTPGSSPGAGHIIPDANVEANKHKKEHEIMTEYDSRQTTPGASPGAGHLVEGKKTNTTARRAGNSPGELSHTEELDQDIKSTGKSPGAGHIIADAGIETNKQSKEHKTVRGNDFQQTTPGASPGAGLQFGGKKNICARRLGNGSGTGISTEQLHEMIQPTGRSPGAGHVIADTNTETRKQGKEHEPTRKNALLPTTPGASPGAGHHFEGKKG